MAANAMIALKHHQNDEADSGIMDIQLSMDTPTPLISSSVRERGRNIVQQLLKEGMALHGAEEEDFQVTEKEIHSLIRIQAIFRGVRVRSEIATSWPDAFLLTGKASLKVLESIVDTYRGITKLLAQVIFVIVFSLMVHFQLYSQEPTAFEMKQSFVDIFTRVPIGENGYSLEQVDLIPDIYDYLRGFLNDVHAVDPLYEQDPSCDDSIEEFCQILRGGNYTSKGKFIGHCIQMSKNSGYMGPHAHTQLAIFLKQKRRKHKTCGENKKKPVFDTYAKAMGEGGGRVCLTDEEADVFESQYYDIHQDEFQKITSAPFNHLTKFRETGVFNFALASGVLNMNKQYPLCEIDHLEEVQWVDERTKELCIFTLASNLQGDGAFVYGELCFQIGLGGKITESMEVGASHLFQVEDQIPGLILFSIFCGMVMISTIRIGMKLKVWGEQLCKTRKTNISASSIIAHESTFWLVVDVSMLMLYYYAISTYITLVVTGENFSPRQITPSILRDLNQLGVFFEDIFDIREIVGNTRRYKNICGMILLILVLQTVRYLNFHPDFGIVTRTIKKGLFDLAHFGVVFVGVVLFYSYAAVLLIGDYVEAYNTIGLALNELLFIAMGEMEDAKETIFKRSYSSFGRQVLLDGIFFWSYVFVVSLILLNILLSVIIDAFVRVQDEKNNNRHFGIITSFKVWFCMFCWDIKTRFHCGLVPGSNKAKVEGTFVRGLTISPDMEQGKIDLWERSCSSLDIQNFESSRAWIAAFENSCKRKSNCTFFVRKQLEQIFSAPVAERIINIIRYHSIRQRAEEREAKNSIFKRKAGDIAFTNFTMIKSLYDGASIKAVGLSKEHSVPGMSSDDETRNVIESNRENPADGETTGDSGHIQSSKQ